MSGKRFHEEHEIDDDNGCAEECFDSDDEGPSTATENLELVYSESEGETQDMEYSETLDGDVSDTDVLISKYESAKDDSDDTSGLITADGVFYRDSILESFQLFFSKKIVDDLVKHSNDEADRKNVQATNAAELYAYVGILLIMGALRDSKLSIDNLWGGVKCRASYIGVMSRERFRQLTCILRFDDYSKRDDLPLHQQRDKFAPLRKLFGDINELFASYFVPGPRTTIGEILSLFRGNCPFKICARDKPGKYGILIRALSDVDSKYVVKMEVETSENIREQKSVIALVKRLVMPIAGSGRSVTTGQYYTSVDLAQDLWQNCGLTIIGALKKCDDNITDILSDLNTEVFATKLGSRKISLIPADSKRKDQLLATYQSEKGYTGVNLKNEIIDLYNSSKDCVNDIDNTLRIYSIKRGTRRWPLSLFYTLVDITALNSYTLFQKKNPEWSNRKNCRLEYLLRLGNMLVRPHVQDRTRHAEGLHKPILTAMEMILDEKGDPTSRVLSKPLLNKFEIQVSKTGVSQCKSIEDTNSSVFPRHKETSTTDCSTTSRKTNEQVPQPRKRCYICTRNAKLKNCRYSELSKSKQRCGKCARPVCQKHSKRIISCLKCDEED